jgi:hypothetical protein
MITEEILLSMDFGKKEMVSLPDWFYLFETDPIEKNVPSYCFFGDWEYYMRVYFSPKGTFGEISAYDEFDFSHSYVALHTREDVEKAIEDYLVFDRDDEGN